MLALASLGIAAVAAGGFFGLQMMNERAPQSAVASIEKQPTSATTAVAENNSTSDDPSLHIPATDILSETIDGEGAVADDAMSDGSASETDPSVEETSADAPVAEQIAEETTPPATGPGDVFADCDICPKMRILPAGTFLMGSPDDEPGRFPYEGPQHEVTVGSFAIGVYEVTFDQFAACVEDGGCGGYDPGDAGFGRGSRPALYISWRDAQRYVEWLTRKTGRTYRLPSEAEWEYAARGGEASAYWWGSRFDRSKAAIGGTVEVGAFAANGFGLHEILGNAGEWVQDCYLNNFTETPVDGSPATTGDCGRRVVRGGSWRGEPRELRAANRGRITSTVRDGSLGFRVAAELE